MFPSVIEKVVNHDLCIGCGICVPSCKSKSLKMSFNADLGMQIPEQINDCNLEGDCLKVCPFNPIPEESVKSEDKIIENLNLEVHSNNKHFGRYKSITAGFSKEYQKTSSSGGVATWLLHELLNKNVVDAVIVVEKSNSTNSHYEYKVLDGIEGLTKASKTKYYPLSLDKIIFEIKKSDKRFAITAIPCFLKAIRLKQFYDADLKQKITFCIGIFCGGLKTSLYTDYLSSRCGVEKENIKNPEYRIKNELGTAIDYSFGVENQSTNELKKIKMKEVGDMWGTGLFKPTACEFCDDLSSELADISLGDAWIPPYDKDGRGANIVITRSNLAEELIKSGIRSEELVLDPINEGQAERSQRGNINHRRKGLAFRLFLAKLSKKRSVISEKRISPKILLSPIFILVLLQRNKVRTNSFKYWNKYKNAKDFDKAMEKSKFLLRIFTKVNSKLRFDKKQ